MTQYTFDAKVKAPKAKNQSMISPLYTSCLGGDAAKARTIPIPDA